MFILNSGEIVVTYRCALCRKKNVNDYTPAHEFLSSLGLSDELQAKILQTLTDGMPINRKPPQCQARCCYCKKYGCLTLDEITYRDLVLENRGQYNPCLDWDVWSQSDHEMM